MVFGCELGLLKCIASRIGFSPCIDMIGGGTCMVAAILVLLIAESASVWNLENLLA